MRCYLALVMSLIGTGSVCIKSEPMFFRTDLLSFPVTTVSSTQVFHAPQAGHLPNHFGDSLPHSLQKNAVFSFAAMIFVLYEAKVHN